MTHTQTPWEQRRYWHDGVVVRVEWWHGLHVVEEVPLRLHLGPIRDYCHDHGSRIYPDLGCEVCRQRPGHVLP